MHLAQVGSNILLKALYLGEKTLMDINKDAAYKDSKKYSNKCFLIVPISSERKSNSSLREKENVCQMTL